jgi:histidinol-phosphate/aromatic aminotransferase/cobyric acid decarboxylase-like protein
VVIEERVFLSQELKRRGLTFPPTQANFFLVKVPGAAAVRERLLRAGLVVRDGAALGFPDHLRIAIGTRDTNTRLLRVLDSQ